MKPTRRLSRRSFLSRVAGGVVIGGAALTVLGGEAAAFQITDGDVGQGADPVRRGRGSLTDSDTGNRGDSPGLGRGPRRAVCTDSDTAASSDRAGAGRGTGISDGDRGANADAPRCGRGARRVAPRRRR